MDVTYNASSTEKKFEIQRALETLGYKVTTSGGTRLAYQRPLRVWRVAEADETTVIAAILAADPDALPVVPAPSYTSG